MALTPNKPHLSGQLHGAQELIFDEDKGIACTVALCSSLVIAAKYKAPHFTTSWSCEERFGLPRPQLITPISFRILLASRSLRPNPENIGWFVTRLGSLGRSQLCEGLVHVEAS